MIIALKKRKENSHTLHANIDIAHDSIKCKESPFIYFSLISLLLSDYSVDSTA